MVKVLEVKFVKSRFFDLESYAGFVIMFGQFDNKLRQFFSEGCWEGLGHDRQIINDPKYIPQTSSFTKELPLSISLPSYLDLI